MKALIGLLTVKLRHLCASIILRFVIDAICSVIIIRILTVDIILQNTMHNIHKAIFVTKLVNASIIGTFITANRDITVHCELPLH